jgi:ketosteroid isomerase-like protein
MTSTNTTEQQRIIELEIREAVDRFMKIFATGDAAAIAHTYTANPVVGAPTGDLVRGQPQLLKFWQSVLDGPGMVVESYDVVDVQALGADYASEVTLFNAHIGGQRMSGKYLVVWKREEGQWKLHLDVFNAAPAT